MENRKETVKPFSRGEHRVRGSRSSRLRRGRYRRGVRAHECFDNHDQRDHHDLHTEESTLRENSRPRGDCLSNKRTFSEENTRLQSGSFGGHRQHIRPLRSQEGSPVRGGSPQRRGSHRRGGGPQIDSPWRGGGPQRRGSPRGGGPQIDSPRRGDGPQRGNGPQIRLRGSPRKGGNPRIRGSPQRGGGRQIRDRPQRGGSPREGHFQYWRDYSPGLYHDNESHYSVDLSPSPQFDHQPFRRPADDHPEPYRHSDLSPRPLHDQFQPLRRLDLSPSPARDCPESYHPRDLSPDPGNHIHLRYENISPTQDHDYYEVHHHNRHQNCSPRPSHGRTEHFQHHSGILHFHEHHELPHPQNFEPQDRFRHHPRDFWDHPPDDFHEPPHPRNFPPGQSYDHDEATHQVHCSPPPHDHHGPPHREHPLKSRDWSPVKVPPDQRPMSKNTPQHGTFSRKGHQNFKFYHDGERWQRSQGRGRPHRRSQCSPRRGFGPRNRRQKASSGTRSSRPQDRTRSSSPRDRTCFSSPGDRTRLSPTRGRTRLSPKRDRTNSSQPRNRTCSSPPRGRPHFSPARDQTCFSPPHDRPHSSPARDRILSSPTRDRTNSSLSQNKTDSSQARDKNSFPPQNRAQSSPTGDRTLSLPTRDRAHSSPTRSRTLSSPTRDRAHSSPTRSRTLSSPTRDRAHSSPTRSRTLSSPTRDRAHSSPTRDRKKFSPPRGRTCSSSSISRACLPPPSAQSNTNSSSPPREILPSTSWHKRRVVLKGRRGGSSSQRNMSQSHASSIPHSGRERPKNEKSSHTTETSESRKPDQRRKSSREPVSENQKTLRGKTSMDKLDDPQQKAGSTRKQSPESVTVLGDSTRSSITSASVSKDSGVCPSNEMNSTEAVSSVHLDSTESEVHNAFDNSATLAKYTTDADLQTSETVDTNPVCELMKVCAISEAVAPANTRSLLPHQQPENVEIADILEEQPQRLEINKLSDLTAPSPKFIVSEAMPDVPEALPPHLEGKTAQRTADGAEPAEKNSSNVYSQSGASPTMDLSAAETAEEESQTLTEPMYQPEVFPVSEDDSEDDFPLPRLHTREATHSPYRPVLSPVSDASIDDPSQPEALDMSTTENIHSKPPTLSSQPVFPLFSETWSSSNVFMSHAAEEGPQTNVESACRYQPGVSPVSDSDDNDDQIHLSVPRMQGVTISPYRPVLSPVSDASDDGAVDVLVSAGIDQPQHQSYNTVQVKTPSTGAQDKLQSQVERLASPPNRHSRSSRDVQSGQNPEEGKDEVGADRPADAEECQSPRSDGTTDNCSSGDAIILDLSDTDIPLPGPEGDAGEDHPHEGTCQDRPKSGSTNNDISLAQGIQFTHSVTQCLGDSTRLL
ncbi:hypothetical protein BaRGS_00033379 [Batillaria attramentaria]|uniref:Serine/arginine repetitive matrix protein 2-like n=1 Tax=Batillaria attramentaria TaxID=370345 RepID=A0ABD0JK84_9CAEN